MKRSLLVFCLLLILLEVVGLVVPVSAADTPPIAAQKALDWLSTQQQNDGSFPGFGVGTTADAVFAFAASGRDPHAVQKNGSSPISFLSSQAITYTGILTPNVAATGKLVMAIVAADDNPRSFAGLDLVNKIERTYNAATGRYGASPNPLAQSYALLALASASRPISSTAIAALRQFQLPDGGWSFDGNPATGSDTNTTALAVQALIAAGEQGESLTKALTYLESQQRPDGGFPFAAGGDTDPNSTAYVIQALASAGRDVRALKKGDNDPISALLRFQNANGSFRSLFAPEDTGTTIQAIPALLLKPFPLRPFNRQVILYLPLAVRSTAAAHRS